MPYCFLFHYSLFFFKARHGQNKNPINLTYSLFYFLHPLELSMNSPLRLGTTVTVRASKRNRKSVPTKWLKQGLHLQQGWCSSSAQSQDTCPLHFCHPQLRGWQLPSQRQSRPNHSRHHIQTQPSPGKKKTFSGATSSKSEESEAQDIPFQDGDFSLQLLGVLPDVLILV